MSTQPELATLGHDDLDGPAARDAVAVAIRAPSILNTQPWHWELDGGLLGLRADRTRQLATIDPDGHSLLLSCGAALHLAQLALSADGWSVETERNPDRDDPDLLARVWVRGRHEPSAEATERVTAARQRHSERRPFEPTVIAAQLLEQLTDVGRFEGVSIRIPREGEEMIVLAVAVDWAEQLEANDPEFRAELDTWIRPSDTQSDGVPATAIPHVRAGHPRHTDVSVGDYGLDIPGQQTIAAEVDERPLLALVLTTADDTASRLRAGEATMAMLIEAHRHGLATCIISQAFASPASRTRLRDELGSTAYPQTMVRLGAMPAGPPAPATRRRPVDDVLRIRDART